MTPTIKPVTPITAKLKLILVALLVAVIFAGGWLVNGWRMETQLSDLKRHYAEQAATAARQHTFELTLANDRADQLQKRLRSEENAHQTTLEEKRDALRRLTAGRPCLSEPAVRVLNGSGSAILPGLVSQASGELVSGDAAFATDTDVSFWIASAQRAYNICRSHLRAIENFYDRKESQ